jgi:two-component system sensor kinase FixL
MKWQWGRVTILGGVIFALTFFVVSTVYLGAALYRLRDSLTWVQHTYGVLLKCGTVDQDIAAAEEAKWFSDPGDQLTFSKSKEVIHSSLNDLAGMVTDSPAQVEAVRRLRPTVERFLSGLDQSTNMSANRPVAVLMNNELSGLRIELSGLRNEIKEHLADFRKAESDLLNFRQTKAEGEIARAFALTIATSILSLLFAGASVVSSVRGSRSMYKEKELQIELLHVSRLNMMGQMASLLAHELQQPLGATSNYLKAMTRRIVEIKGQPELTGLLVDILKRSNNQMDRAGEIVQRLRKFIAKGLPTQTVEGIEPIFDEAVALLGPTSKGISISCTVQPDTPFVYIDKIQIEQVLINLIRNAIQALEPTHCHVLELSAAATEAGDAARLEVRDFGPGLDESVRSRLFQPFVTTKPDGLGLGLSICHSIITANGGTIAAESNPDGGTVFVVTLPAAAAGAKPRVDRSQLLVNS